MNNILDHANSKSPAARTAPAWAPWLEFALIALGLAVMFLPTYYDLARGPWTNPHEAHGPFVFAIVIGTAVARWKQFLAARGSAPVAGTFAIVVGVLLYIVGRSQEFLVLETSAQVPVLVGVLLCLKGWQGLRILWFPAAFIAFTIVWPNWFIDRLTLPLKQVATNFTVSTLYNWGYPVSSTGVVIMVGAYQLQVADACSGLNTIISLMSVGVLYLYMIARTGFLRNALIIAAMPFIALAANVLRIMGLALITYHFGQAAGDSFIHQFAGLFLFAAALALVFMLDAVVEHAGGLIRRLINLRRQAA